MPGIEEVRQNLHGIDGHGYNAYREIRGAFTLDAFTRFIDQLQRGPSAGPSKLHSRTDHDCADPECANPKIAIPDADIRAESKRWGRRNRTIHGYRSKKRTPDRTPERLARTAR